MPAARFWRIVAIDTYAAGDLELSEFALYEGTARVDGSASVSSTAVPVAGVLSALSDGSFSTSARWSGEDVRLPGFAVVWDFGAPQEVTGMGVAGPSKEMFPHTCSVHRSEDGIFWRGGGALFLEYADSDTFASPENFSEHRSGLELLLHFDGDAIDRSYSRKSVSMSAGATIETGSAKFGSGYLSAPGFLNTRCQIEGVLRNIGDDDFTIEMFVRVRSPLLGREWGSLFQLGNEYQDGVLNIVRNGSSSPVTLFQDYHAGGYIGAPVAGTLPGGVWVHLAVSRVNGVLRVFIGGVKGLERAPGPGSTLVGGTLTLGNRTTLNSELGVDFDEVTVINGVGLYVNDFTPPNGPVADPAAAPVIPRRTPTAQPVLLGEDVVGFTQPATCVPPSPFDIYDAGRGRITGTVKEKNAPINTPLARRVILFSMPGSRAIRETWSDPTTGAYEFTEVPLDRVYTVISYDHTGAYRAVVSDNIQPTLMP